jgi:hypothetical protein
VDGDEVEVQLEEALHPVLPHAHAAEVEGHSRVRRRKLSLSSLVVVGVDVVHTSCWFAHTVLQDLANTVVLKLRKLGARSTTQNGKVEAHNSLTLVS